MIQRFRDWLEYEVQAHGRVLESLAGVPERGRRSAAYQRALDVFAHVLAARRLWLARFGAIDAPQEPFPTGLSLEALEPLQRTVAAEWRRWLHDASEEDLAREFEYTAHEGGRFASTYEQILTQLFGHSHYHRGQIAMLVAECGGTPAETDYVVMTRRPIESEA